MASIRNTPGAGHLLNGKLASTEYRAVFQYQFPAEALALGQFPARVKKLSDLKVTPETHCQV